MKHVEITCHNIHRITMLQPLQTPTPDRYRDSGRKLSSRPPLYSMQRACHVKPCSGQSLSHKGIVPGLDCYFAIAFESCGEYRYKLALPAQPLLQYLQTLIIIETPSLSGHFG